MKALVLAAGAATRMAPLSGTLPKPLIPVANRPVMEHVLDRIRRAGIQEVGIVHRSDTEALRRYFGDGDFGVKYTWLPEDRPRGTGGSLRDCRDFIGAEPVLVLHCDLVSTVDLARMVAHHLADPCTVTVAASERDPALWHGDYVTAEKGHAVAYHYQPPSQPAPYSLGTCGTWIVEPSALDLVPDGFSDFNHDVLAVLPGTGHRLGVFDASPAYHCDVGTFQSFHEGNLDAVSGTAGIELPEPVERHEAVVRGPVLIGPGVVLGRGAEIYGPSVLGQDAIIGPDARIVASVVLPGACVPPGITLAVGIMGDARQAVETMCGRRDTGGSYVVSGHGGRWYRH